MTTFDNHANLAYSLVAAAPSPATSGVSLSITSGDHTKFPAAPFNLTVWPGAGATASAANAEIVRVAAVAGDTLTIVRAQEGTTAQSVAVGYQVALTGTAKLLTDIEAAINAMPVAALQPIGSPVILGSAQASVTFSAIPGGYSSLLLVGQARGDTSAIAVALQAQMNGDTGTDYSGEYLYGVGTGPASADQTNQPAVDIGFIPAATAPSGAAGSVEMDIPGYAGTVFRKTLAGRAGLTNADTTSGHVIYSLYGEWKSTAAITSIKVFAAFGNLVAGSSFALYGRL